MFLSQFFKRQSDCTSEQVNVITPSLIVLSFNNTPYIVL